MASNRDIVRGVYEGYARGDAQPLLAALSDHVEFRLCAPADALRVAGAYRGPIGVRDAIAAINDEYQWLRFELRCLIAEGDTVVALTGGRLRHRPSGVEMELDIGDLVHLRDGRIVEFAEFFDSAGVIAWQSGAPAPQRPSAVRQAFGGGADEGSEDPAADRQRMQSAYAAYARRDPQPFLDLLSDGASYFTVARLEDLGFAATPRGKAAFAADIARIGAEYDVERYALRELIADGGLVAANADTAFRHKVSGKLVTVEKLDVFRFAGGRVAQFCEFFDTASALRQLGRRA